MFIVTQHWLETSVAGAHVSHLDLIATFIEKEESDEAAISQFICHISAKR